LPTSPSSESTSVPPNRVSPPTVSLPEPPSAWSLPELALIESLPAPPQRVSLPPPARIVSVGGRPGPTPPRCASAPSGPRQAASNAPAVKPARRRLRAPEPCRWFPWLSQTRRSRRP
jgi:hypothetical protein